MFKEGSFLKELFHRTKNDDVAGLSAQLSYFFLLSLFPFLIFMITLVGYLPISQEDVLGTIRGFAPGETLDMIEETLEQILNKKNGGLLSFGIIATIWSASNGINAIVKAFNRAYDVDETRSFLVARGMAIVLTIAMVFVILVALLLPVFGSLAGPYLGGIFIEYTKNISYFLIISFMLLFIFIAITAFRPNQDTNTTYNHGKIPLN